LPGEFLGELYRSRDNGESWTKLPSRSAAAATLYIRHEAKDGALHIASSKGITQWTLHTPLEPFPLRRYHERRASRPSGRLILRN
jgi:photosystem II stability/assembly factor-like uncharacterized protein